MSSGTALEARKRSVDNLQRIYTVLITLAATELLKRLFIIDQNGPQMPNIGQWLQLICFLATIIPFYHGSNRYLDATYVTGERKANDSALMLDFFALFIAGLSFFVAGVYFNQPIYFYVILAALFVWDGFWVILTKLTTTSDQHSPNGMKFGHWAPLNFCTAALIWISIATSLWEPSFRFSTISMIIITRSFIDYYLGWEFYYPKLSDNANTSKENDNTQNTVENKIESTHSHLETPAFQRKYKEAELDQQNLNIKKPQ